MSIQEFINTTSTQIQEKAKECYQNTPSMKEGVFYSFAISAGVSVILSSNITTAVGVGLLAATVSALDTIASSILKTSGGSSNLDQIKELSKRSVCIFAASLILNRGQNLVNQVVKDILIQGVLMFYQRMASYKQEGNQMFLMLRV